MYLVSKVKGGRHSQTAQVSIQSLNHVSIKGNERGWSTRAATCRHGFWQRRRPRGIRSPKCAAMTLARAQAFARQRQPLQSLRRRNAQRFADIRRLLRRAPGLDAAVVKHAAARVCLLEVIILLCVQRPQDRPSEAAIAVCLRGAGRVLEANLSVGPDSYPSGPGGSPQCKRRLVFPRQRIASNM